MRRNAEYTIVEYMYRQGQLICAADDLNRALVAFDQAGLDRPLAIADGPARIAVLDVRARDAAGLADTLADVAPTAGFAFEGANRRYSPYCPRPTIWRVSPVSNPWGDS
ncbi:MAG: hypothetical protein ACRDVZ_00795 [Jiangellaceae bacterium]